MPAQRAPARQAEPDDRVQPGQVRERQLEGGVAGAAVQIGAAVEREVEALGGEARGRLVDAHRVQV